MTDKEFKRLNRVQLIEIIYKLQLEVDALTKQNKSLENALEDKRLRINNAGNLAEAALEINNCFVSAQNAAEQYLNEINNRVFARCGNLTEIKLHNNINVLALGAEYISVNEAVCILRMILATEFEGGRHNERLNMIKEIEKDNMK